MFIILLSSIVNTSSISLSNQKYMIQPSLISLHPNAFSQEFYF